ncbi:nucleotidyl transferase AbiEii/AbiGii toxin family protein [Candidatus Dojkabacteria bacterium]|nr:nucleotidyl transferase AbiEii/AbiGii toxin family protein [Candidatus Dojkabacteria bacterium]
MLIDKLKLKFKELKEEGKTEDSILIALKEILQHYILNFIYTSKNYSYLTMYGGTVLRIGYNLPRMSEDLDFQTHKKLDLEKFTEEIKRYFKDNYAFDIEVKHKSSPENNTSTLFIKFFTLKELGFKKLKLERLHVKVDVNYFETANKFVNDTVPGGKGTELAYTIKTYPLSTLMASKAVAFLKRDARGIGDILTNVKSRDVYDMMWYMNRGTMPDLEYLKAKDISFDTFLDFRDKVKIRANKIEDNAFRNDLSQFFYDRNELENWLSSWRPKFMQLLDSYKVYEVGELERIYGHVDFSTDNRSISYTFNALDNQNQNVIFSVTLTDYWFEFRDIKINRGHRVAEIEDKAEKGRGEMTELDYEYIGLFYTKIKDYLKRNKNVVFQNEFETKVIRASADNLDPKKQIYLDKRLLEKIDFEELL